MKARYIPNIISILRILLVVPVAVCLLERRYTEALLLFTVAGLSDGVDGYLARRFNWITRLGAILDPLADKLLMMTTYLILGWLDKLPLWLVGVVILRDVVIVSGGLAYRFFIGELVIEPIISSKVNTILQIMLVFVVLASLSVLPVPPDLIKGLIMFVFASTLVSGGCYVFQWGRRAWLNRPVGRGND